MMNRIGKNEKVIEKSIKTVKINSKLELSPIKKESEPENEPLLTQKSIDKDVISITSNMLDQKYRGVGFTDKYLRA